jgi:hypothetical protein
MHHTRFARRILALTLAAVLVATALAGCAGTSSPSETISTGPTAVGGSTSRQAGGQSLAYDSGTASAPEAAAGAAAPSAEKSTGSGGATVVSADRMVIRNASMRLEVPHVTAAVTKLRALVASYGGVVSSLQLTSDTGGGTPIPLVGTDAQRAVPSGLPFSASVTALVPVTKYEAFRAEAEKLGTVRSEGSSDQDVTQEHADLKARLLNSRAEEARLRSFFDRAKSVTDMLSIERELARVRADIESMTAQLAVMERQAAMATLTVELVEPAAITAPANGIDWGFRESVRSGIQAGVELMKVGLTAAIALSPLWLLALVLFFVVRWRVRVRRARRDAELSEAAEVPDEPAAE